MTLNTRNKLLLSFSIISALCTVFFITAFVRILVKNPYGMNFRLAPPAAASPFAVLTAPNYLAAFCALFFFSLFVPISGFCVFFHFEKTQSLEVLFFSSALLGFFCESFKMCIPLFNITAGYSTFLRFIGQASFFGQMEIVLTIIMQAVFAGGSEGRDADRYLQIIIIAALIFSTMVPLNTTVFENYMNISYGFKDLLGIMRIVFVLCSFLALFFSPKSKESADYKKASVSYLVVCAGYVLLLHCTDFAVFIGGAALLTGGTVHFFKNIHRYYMWK